MPLFVVSGPEKAGKTTLLNAVEAEWTARGLTVAKRRNWNGAGRDPDDPRDVRNLRALMQDLPLAKEADQLVMWDRSWICETIYGTLLGRFSDLADTHLLGEWLYGRAVQALGLSVILLPEKYQQAASRRTPDDLEVHPALEYHAYSNYANEHGVLKIENNYDELSLMFNTTIIVDSLLEARFRPTPPGYAGPKDAKVIVVAESFEANPFLGEWLPLSHRHGIELAKELGPEIALQLGWATARQFPPNLIRKADTLIAIGDGPARWCEYYIGHKDIRTTGVGLSIAPSRQRNIDVIKQAVMQTNKVGV